MEEYDVIVIGAGPAGGKCAGDLASMGRSVLLLEKSNVIGLPNFSTAGTPNETMEIFNLPKSITDSPWKSLLIASKGARAEFVSNKRLGYVLNYTKLKQFLSKKAKKKGADVISGARAEDLKRGKNLSEVLYRKDDSVMRARAKVVVDATGGRASFSQKLGLVKLSKSDLAVGIEYHMGNIKFERKYRLDFYLGPDYAPGGYAWIFPKGGSSAKVGVGILNPSKMKIDAMAYLKKLVKENPQTSNAVQTDLHSGSLFANGGIKNHVLDGFIVIGDAAAQINPLGGEGIRHAMYSGVFTAKTINTALEKNNWEEKNLSSYNTLWKNYVGKKWSKSMFLNKIVYNRSLNNELTDKAVKAMSIYSTEEIFDILFNYNFSVAKKKVLETAIKNPIKLVKGIIRS